MTLEIDPDLRLYTRLSFGRGTDRIVGVVGVVTFAVFLAIFPGPKFLLRALAFTLLVFAGWRAIDRTVEYEGNGLLDHARLCGRPPYRLLAGFVVGSTWPTALATATILAVHVWFEAGDPRLIWTAPLVFAAVISLALLAYSASSTPTRSGRSLVLVLPFLALVALLGGGLLIHELTWRIPVVSLSLRLGLLVALTRPWQLAIAIATSGQPDVPQLLQPVDLVGLTGTFAGGALWHAHRRQAVSR